MKLRYSAKPPEAEIASLFSLWMEELFELDDKAVYLDADLMGSLKTAGLWHKRPDRVFNCGIQEANMVGVAAGLFLAGYKPYIHSFAPFITRRVYDQLFLSAGYAHKNIRLIGSDAGIMASANGGTHMCFEDIALLRVIPDACIVDVTDAVMFHSLLQKTKDWQGIVYFRTARRGVPDIYEEGTEFHPGKGYVLTDGRDVTIVASGIMVATALEARKLLASEGIDARIVDPVTIKPLDEDMILSCASETGAVVTAENHNVLGGLGGAVAELLSERCPVPVLRVGVQDRLGQTGTVDYLRQVYGLQPENIVEKVHTALNMKN